MFACVGWQEILCDPIWQVTPRSSEMAVPRRTYLSLTFFLINRRFTNFLTCAVLGGLLAALLCVCVFLIAVVVVIAGFLVRRQRHRSETD